MSPALLALEGAVIGLLLGLGLRALLVRGLADIGERVDALAAHVEEFTAPGEPDHGFVRIHQTEGKPTIEGVLVAREPQYVLKNAALIEAEGRTIELDGPIEILREHVAMVQRLGTLEPTT